MTERAMNQKKVSVFWVIIEIISLNHKFSPEQRNDTTGLCVCVCVFFYEVRRINHVAAYQSVHYVAAYQPVHYIAAYQFVHYMAAYQSVHYMAAYQSVHYMAAYQFVHLLTMTKDFVGFS